MIGEDINSYNSLYLVSNVSDILNHSCVVSMLRKTNEQITARLTFINSTRARNLLWLYIELGEGTQVSLRRQLNITFECHNPTKWLHITAAKIQSNWARIYLYLSRLRRA